MVTSVGLGSEVQEDATWPSSLQVKQYHGLGLPIDFLFTVVTLSVPAVLTLFLSCLSTASGSVDSFWILGLVLRLAS